MGEKYRIGRGGFAAILIMFLTATPHRALGQAQVTTYHYDNNRTGWNQNETVLTPANVTASTFGVLQQVTLDDQVDAQPLVIPGVLITAGSFVGTHDVVYVATENNSVYAIDVHSGTVLLTVNLGTPVSAPLTCNNNGPNVGINSTPVIDPASNTLYVMAYTQAGAGPTYTLHALDLGSLTDKVTPTIVAASHTLSNGSSFVFNATYQRQRPALVLANGNVYAGFGSFCDYSANVSRGWLLGWQEGTLTPLTSSEMFDTQASSPNTFFLSSLWMSGYGPSVDDSGNLLVVTGNSDGGGTTYDGVTDIQESVIAVSPNLSSIVDLFTPSDWANLDEHDEDFGAGGVMVLPDQSGSIPHLAVAAGKDGNMYLMNEDSLGGYSSSTNNVLGTYQISPCWCGPSYFVDPSDGAARVVSSGGDTVQVWKLQTSPSVSLTDVTGASVASSSIQDPGFFTSVSSDGTANPIVWAVTRPTSTKSGSPITLYAFNPDAGGSSMTKLLQVTAGAWPNVNGNANLVPVVANGQVFVASNKQLQILGLTTNAAPTPTISPDSKSFTGSLSVSISDTNSAATILYTTDGSTPAPGGKTTQTYSGTPFSVTTTTTVKAIASLAGSSNSSIATATYTLQALPTPTITPGSESVAGSISVSISDANSSATILYTTDGSTPTPGGSTTQTYSTSLSVTSPATVQAIATLAGYSNSALATASYTLPAAPAPTITPASQTFTSTVSVSIGDSNTAATILYTTDGSTPAPGGATTQTYSAPFSVASTTTVRAIATLTGYANSPLTTAVYTLLIPGSSFYVRAGTSTPYTDPSGNVWVEDEDYSGGASSTPTTHAISNTTTQPLYQTGRFDAFTYTFPGLPVGASYVVTLKFAETYWTAAGQRIFNVILNGTTVLSNFDIFADAGGEYIADDKTFSTTVNSAGQVVIQFQNGSADYAKVDAIQLVSGVALTAPSIAPASQAFTGTLTVSMSDTNPAATILYTIDGSTPTPGGATTQTYTAPFSITASTTVKAIAALAGYANSPVATAAYTLQNAGTLATTTTLSSSLNPSVLGKAVIFTAKVSPQSGSVSPTGSVEFLNGASVMATVALKSGSARYTSTSLPPADNSISAAYQGSSSYSGSTSSPVSQVVMAPTTTTLTSSLNPSEYGQSLTFSASVASSAGAPPDGETVTFKEGTTLLGTGILAGGTATLSLSTLAVGPKKIQATYVGDINYTASTSPTFDQSITKASTSTALTSSLGSSSYQQPVTWRATVTPQFSGAPTGTVAFKNGTTTLKVVPLSGSTASYTSSNIAVGSASITATYSGSTSLAASTSQALDLTVGQATSTTQLTSSLNPSTTGQSVTFTAAVTSENGGAVSGSVTFTDGATTLKTVKVTGGTASLTTSELASGMHTITATYDGSADFVGSSTSLTQTVN
jgi:hypothetical protein